VEFTEVVRRRHMVRRFTNEPVAPESLDRILRNAVRGPSAGVLADDDVGDGQG
jgi:nitroreductase